MRTMATVPTDAVTPVAKRTATNALPCIGLEGTNEASDRPFTL